MTQSQEQKSDQPKKILFHLNVDVKENEDGTSTVSIRGVGENKLQKASHLQLVEQKEDVLQGMMKASEIIIIGTSTLAGIMKGQ